MFNILLGRSPKTSWFQINHLMHFFITFIPYLPPDMASHWVRWIIVNQKIFKFDVFRTSLKSGRPCTSEADIPLMDGIYCTCGLDCDDVSVLLLFSGAMLSSLLGAFLGSSSRYVLNQVSLRSFFSGATLCELSCTISVQFWGIFPYLINVTLEKSSSNTTWNLGDTWPVAGFITKSTDTA